MAQSPTVIYDYTTTFTNYPVVNSSYDATYVASVYAANTGGNTLSYPFTYSSSSANSEKIWSAWAETQERLMRESKKLAQKLKLKQERERRIARLWQTCQ